MILFLLLAALGIPFLMIAARFQGNISLIKRTPTVSCADVTRRTDLPGNERLEITGTALPGASGPLTAPLSGEPCVWYAMQVVKKPGFWKMFTDRLGGRFALRSSAVSESTDVELPQRISSSQPFRVHDYSGVVDVLPDGVEVPSGRLRVKEFESNPPPSGVSAGGSLAARARRGFSGDLKLAPNIRCQYCEWIVSPDAPVYVLGMPVSGDDGFAIGAPDDGEGFVIGAGTEDGVVSKLRIKVLAVGGVGVLFLVIGLGMSIFAIIRTV